MVVVQNESKSKHLIVSLRGKINLLLWLNFCIEVEVVLCRNYQLLAKIFEKR